MTQLILQKMKTHLKDCVEYEIEYEKNSLNMNALINKELTLTHSGKIICSSCQKQTKKSFMQGFCYPCMIKVPEASECIIKPELCRGHEGIGRDPDWEEKYHNKPHYVYLAKSSAIKVGVTRDSQVPTRWIDQGAIEAITIAETPNRYLSGCLEIALKEYITDRTGWQKMLKNEVTDQCLIKKVKEITNYIPTEFKQYVIKDKTHKHIQYPVEKYPVKVKSINLDKTPIYSGILKGIKGQYLIFEDNHVINIRKYTGYEVTINH